MDTERTNREHTPTTSAGAGTRTETDSLGEVEVDRHRYWGAQTQRAVQNFDIGRDTFVWGRPLLHALGLVKRCAAQANQELAELGLPEDRAQAVIRAAREVEDGLLDEQFPLVVFQTGSGTATNMNANEVIAGRANELLGAGRGGKSPVHPNDHVNRGQSSNDVFPTVLHVAVALRLGDHLLPAATGLRNTLAGKAEAFADVVKVGRTHLQDAAPITVGQEFAAWVSRLDGALGRVEHARERLLGLAIGGTAVGTGLNSHPEFGNTVARLLAAETGLGFHQASDLLAAISSTDVLNETSAALRALAVVAAGIAGDVRWLSSGPRAGLSELRLPANEPGSSIMPGKVNPTQAEALQMVAARVVGNDAAVVFAAGQPALQLHVGKPVVGHAVLESVQLLGDALSSFERHCAQGIDVDAARLDALVRASLMPATALNPHIGYDAAARIVKVAAAENLTLRQAALSCGVAEHDFDRWVDPAAMAHAAKAAPGR